MKNRMMNIFCPEALKSVLRSGNNTFAKLLSCIYLTQYFMAHMPMVLVKVT